MAYGAPYDSEKPSMVHRSEWMGKNALGKDKVHRTVDPGDHGAPYGAPYGVKNLPVHRTECYGAP